MQRIQIRRCGSCKEFRSGGMDHAKDLDLETFVMQEFKSFFIIQILPNGTAHEKGGGQKDRVQIDKRPLELSST
jgi:hypothetical protein